jgi:PAS domain S-box-containing protein
MDEELIQLYANAPIGLALVDRDHRFVRVNERLAAINGRSVADHLGRTIREVIPKLADVVCEASNRSGPSEALN